MSATSPFPLFNFPLIAIHDVLKRTVPLELIHLCLVSKKTQAVVKSFLKRYSSKMNYKLGVSHRDRCDILKMNLWHDDNKKLQILFRTIDDCLYKDIQYPKIVRKFDNVDMLVNVNYDNNIFNIFSQNANITSNNMLQYLCKIFNPIISGDIQTGDEFLALGVLYVMKNENARVDKFSLESFNLSGYIYQGLLDSPINTLDMMCCPSYNFRYKPSDEPMKFKKLQMADAYWVRNLEDFLHCKKVILNGTFLMGADLNRFLKKWMELDCQLEYLELSMSMHEPNLREIVKGLPVFLENFENRECFTFLKSNGKKATIHQSDRYIILQTVT